MRNLVLAALLVPSLAHAEFAARKASDVRVVRVERVEAPPVSVDHVLDKVNRTYMAGLRRCYNRGLAKDASLAGTVTLTFTVMPYGRVSGEAAGITPKVDRCLTAQVGTWRFPTAAARKEATFRLKLQLGQ